MKVFIEKIRATEIADI